MTGLRITGIDGAVRTLAEADLAELAGDDGAVPVAEVVAAAGGSPAATHCTAISRDGSYRASVPMHAMLAGGRIVLRRDGRALGPAEGGPLRLIVVDGTTLCWNVKELEELRLSIGPLPDDVPANPPH